MGKNVEMETRSSFIKVDKNRMNKKQQMKKINEEQPTQKMIYWGLDSALTFIIELHGIPIAEKYVNAMANSIRQSFNPNEIQKLILNLFKTVSIQTIKELKPKEYNILTKVFGESLWG